MILRELCSYPVQRCERCESVIRCTVTMITDLSDGVLVRFEERRDCDCTGAVHASPIGNLAAVN